MRRLLAWSLGALLLAGVASAALPDQFVRTGDWNLDRTLRSIAAEERADPSSFWSAVSKLHGIPEAEILSARQATGLHPADMYMASSIAHITGRPIATVAEEYRGNQGKGWGVMAKELGIKPGSPEFHRLKSDARGTLSHMKAAKKDRQRHEKQLKQEHERRAKQESQGKGGGKSH